MQLTIHIDLDNEAFEQDRRFQIERILEQLCDDLPTEGEYTTPL